MDAYDQSLVDFLKDPENFAFYVQLNRVAGGVEAEMKRSFWNSVAERVRQSLGNPSEINIAPLIPEGKPTGEPTGVCLSYATHSISDNQCFISFEQEQGSYLLYSVRFIKPVTLSASSESLRRIRGELADKGYQLKGDEVTNWIGWRYFKGVSLNDPATLSRLASDDAFAGVAANDLLELFRELGPHVMQLQYDFNKS